MFTSTLSARERQRHLSATCQRAAWFFYTTFQIVIPLSHSNRQSYGEKFAWVDWPNLMCWVKKKGLSEKVCQRRKKNTCSDTKERFPAETVWMCLSVWIKSKSEKKKWNESCSYSKCESVALLQSHRYSQNWTFLLVVLLFRGNFLFLLRHNAVLMLGVGLGNKYKWLVLEKHRGLTKNTCSGQRDPGRRWSNCPWEKAGFGHRKKWMEISLWFL